MQQGSAELPLAYVSHATALALMGPGGLSLDDALGIEVPRALAALTAAGVAAGIAVGLLTREQPSQGKQLANDRDEDRASASIAEQPGPEPSKPAENAEPLRSRQAGGDAYQL